jgi:hypothetical protein
MAAPLDKAATPASSKTHEANTIVAMAVLPEAATCDVPANNKRRMAPAAGAAIRPANVE